MLKIHKIPNGEPVSNDFRITINGQSAETYLARVSAIPFNRVWPGYQRSMDQTELVSFIYFSMDEGDEIKLKITADKDFSDVCIRPLSKNIKPVISGRDIEFTLTQIGQYSLELDGYHNNLHIFANPTYNFHDEVDINDPNVIYFGEGIHNPGVIELKSGQTLFLDEGSVVYTAVIARKAKNVRVIGTGILDNSWEKRETAKGPLNLFNCMNAEVKGIIFRDSTVWTATIYNSDNVTFDNIKAIGMWRYNSDGIDFVNSANGIVKNSFLRNFDDVIVLKGLKGYDTRNVENILVSNCVLWCDWGRELEIGAETCANEYRNIIFEDCDLIHGAHIRLDFQNGDRASVHDVLFNNIRIEYSKYTLKPVYQHSDDQVYDPGNEPFMPHLFFAHLYNGMWSKDYLYGENYDIKFKNIYVQLDEGLPIPPSSFTGVNEEHQTYNITIDGLYFNNKKVENINDMNLETNEFTHDIYLK